jgi:hypothetical protein
MITLLSMCLVYPLLTFSFFRSVGDQCSIKEKQFFARISCLVVVIIQFM